ncbi:MAG: amidohydrolase family-domain-containing protein [Monoraphidium minutum]|nr:MAG: amidohydrolase family-domain-containing protein [Monoraphidium minutum]
MGGTQAGDASPGADAARSAALRAAAAAAALAAAAPARAAAPPPSKKKRMSPMGRALMTLSLAIGAVAVFWPQLAPHAAALSGAAAAWGYTSASGAALPAGHPPVPGATAAPGARAAPGAAAGRRLLWVRGDIWTGDEALPRAASMAIDEASGEVVAVGGEPEAGSSYDVLDFGGAFIMPGFVDSHVHFIPGGLSLSSVDLRRAASREAFVSAVAAAAKKLGPEEWVLGGFWDDNQWGGGLPDASWIDAACGGRPALLTRMDSHLALANSAALARAGVGAGTPDPTDGRVDRDPKTGAPTGILRETAMRLVSSVVPPPSAEKRRAAALDAARYALSRGITSVVDLGRSPFADQGASWADLEEVYDVLADAGELPLRVYAFVPLDYWGALAARVAARGYAHPSGRLFAGGAKAFADGSLGSRTALMHADYADAPGERGARMGDLEGLRRGAAGADAAGLQVAVHAIGDRAVDDVLGIFEEILEARRAGGGGGSGATAAPRPLRVEHAQHLSDAGAAARFGAAAAGLVAVANPQHLVTDAPMLAPRLGAARAAADLSFAWPALAAAGASLAAGSDWPVVDARPLEGVAAAAARARAHAAAAGGAPPGAANAVEAALRMHTADSADAAFVMGRTVGRLTPGRKADFAVLSRSPLEAAAAAAADGAELDAATLAGVGVRSTYVDGRCSFGCGGGAGAGPAPAAAS